MSATVPNPDPDDLPIVVLDDEVPVPSPSVQEYLRRQGITDEWTWAAFRVDQVDDATLARLLSPIQRRQLRPGGLWLPTFDPRQPDRTVGLIRLTPAQNIHRFIGPPAGIAAPLGIDTRHRVVLVDNPLLGMRLHQHGVPGVAIVEDSAVLIPLAGWLAAREVVTITTAKRGDMPLPPGVVPVGTGRIIGSLDHAPAAMLALLGLDAATLRQPVIPEPPSPRILHDLHAYAEGRLQTAEGMAALRGLGLDDADLIRAYRPGYLPVVYRDILPAAVRPAFQGLNGNAIVLPAYDVGGAVVDLLAAKVATNHVMPSLFDAPRGMLAPVLATACGRLVVTDVVRWMGRNWTGAAPVLLVRGPADAAANAARLAAGGVCAVEVRVCRGADDTAAAMRGAGITANIVTDDAMRRPRSTRVAVPTAPALELITHDAVTELATFRCGTMTITAQVPWGTSANLEVVVAVGDRRHRDRFDLGVEAQHRRFATVAALRLEIPAPDIIAALSGVLPAVQALARPAPVPASAPAAGTMTVTERNDAMALLRDGQILERITADLDAAGWVGDEDAKAILVLAAVSRLTPDPVWAALTATNAGERFPGLAALVAITPPEHLLHATRLTDNALANADVDALRHKLLVLDDAHAVSGTVATALKVVRSQGCFTGTRVERDALRGEMRTRFVAAHGPVAVVTAAVGKLPDHLRHHLLDVPLDESPEQSRHRLAARRQRYASSSAQAEGVIQRLQAAQRLLLPLPVVVPDAEHITLPPTIATSRFMQDTLFGLIAASAVLHQYQRPRIDGAVVATARDIAIASRLVAILATAAATGLGCAAQRLLAAMTTSGRTTFTMADLTGLAPDLCRWSIRSALDDLMDEEFVVASRGGRGVARTYDVVGNLSDRPRLAGLAEVGFPLPANLSREVANG